MKNKGLSLLVDSLGIGLVVGFIVGFGSMLIIGHYTTTSLILCMGGGLFGFLTPPIMYIGNHIK